VFGSLLTALSSLGIIERDGERIRRVATLLRFFGGQGFLQSEEWVPHSPEVLQVTDGIFGSAFPATGSSPLGAEKAAAAGDVVYFLINRKATPRQAPQLDISANPKTLHYYDCWKGVPLTPTKAGTLDFSIDVSSPAVCRCL